MRAIKAVLFEPVGCLAEFPAEEFNEIAGSLFESAEPPSKSGSEAYWQLLDLMEHAGDRLKPSDTPIIEELERQAIDRVQLYDCLLYTSPSPRDRQKSRMPSSA